MIRFAALAGMLLTVTAWPLAWNAEYAAKERGRIETEAYMEEIARVGKESLLSADDLMLLSYLKNLRRTRPEVEYATVWRKGQILKFGQGKEGTSYREVRTSVRDSSRSIVLGFDMKKLEQLPAGVPGAPDPALMTLLGACLMLVAVGAEYAGRKRRSQPMLPKPMEAIVGVVRPIKVPLRQRISPLP